MVKKIITLLMACIFLGGSIVLPLGDFLLIRDIPQMYRSYTKITTAEELGVIDFIGDYLLHGKELLGHNEHDKSQNTTNNVQFQHQANPLSVVLLPFHLYIKKIPEVEKIDDVCHKPMMTTDYHQELFRPLLAQVYLS